MKIKYRVDGNIALDDCIHKKVAYRDGRCIRIGSLLCGSCECCIERNIEEKWIKCKLSKGTNRNGANE